MSENDSVPMRVSSGSVTVSPKMYAELGRDMIARINGDDPDDDNFRVYDPDGNEYPR